jgi:hypothetical protein
MTPRIKITADLICAMPDAELLGTMIKDFLESYPQKVVPSSIVVNVTANLDPQWPFPTSRDVG